MWLDEAAEDADGGHGNKLCDGLAVARDGEALAVGDAVEQVGQVPSGFCSADALHSRPRLSRAEP